MGRLLKKSEPSVALNAYTIELLGIFILEFVLGFKCALKITKEWNFVLKVEVEILFSII